MNIKTKHIRYDHMSEYFIRNAKRYIVFIWRRMEVVGSKMLLLRGRHFLKTRVQVNGYL